MLLKRSIRDETLKNRCRIVLVGTFHKYVINSEWKTSKNGVICRCTLDLDSLLVDYNAFSSYRRLSMIFMLTQAISMFSVSMFSKPVMSERHIGIDQGIKNFTIAVVERVGHNCVIVHCWNHTDLQLKNLCAV